MTTDITDQPGGRAETPDVTGSWPAQPLRRATFRVAVIALLAVIAVFQGATWFESWTANNMTQDQACYFLRNDADGLPRDSLHRQEQEWNEIYGCGLDLPLDKSDPNTE